MTASTAIPIVDLEGVDPGSSIIEAYATVGFAYLVRHGVPATLSTPCSLLRLTFTPYQ
ncbi:MAG: hypothetical protein V3V01_09735 [Acidimicrobiales bacterium]